MNDQDLASLISKEVGKQYSLAKEVAEEYPGYCLVTLRGMCKLICQRIIEAKNFAVLKTSELDTLIREISTRTNPDPRSKDALHKLRYLGNKGAHPEEGNIDQAQLLDFARSALDYAVTALKFAHAQLYPGSAQTEIIAFEPVEHGMKALCYRATIQEDADAQYWLGKHFLAQADTLGKSPEEENLYGSFFLAERIFEERKKANYWFRLAANQEHAAALFEHGRLLIEKVDGENYVAMGVNNIFRSAHAGDPDANAQVGHIFYHGLYDQNQDYVEARKHFEIAATEDHPSALTMLGVMYLRGEGGPANPQAAFDYTKKSAEAGYPIGQLNLFVHYWSGEIVEQDSTIALDWLNKAADQCLPEAQFRLAELMQVGLVPGKSLEDAQELFCRCMNTASADQSLRSKAAFQYARLLSNNSNQLQSLTSAADILQRCYEAEKSEGELAQACVELAKAVIKQIRKLITTHQGSAEDITAAEMVSNYFFDSTGKPIPKRSIGLDKLAQTLREMSQAQKDLPPELYQRRLLERFAPTLNARAKPRSDLKLVAKSSAKVGRNDPCPCQSGKKYKHCCGN